jgi:phage terminase small subunit
MMHAPANPTGAIVSLTRKGKKPVGSFPFAGVSRVESELYVRKTMKQANTSRNHLSAASAAFYRSILNDYDLEEHHRVLLVKACESLDRVDEARAVIDKTGLVVTDRFGSLKPNPACAIERDNKIIVARFFRELGLDLAGDGKTAPAALPANRR